MSSPVNLPPLNSRKDSGDIVARTQAAPVYDVLEFYGFGGFLGRGALLEFSCGSRPDLAAHRTTDLHSQILTVVLPELDITGQVIEENLIHMPSAMFCLGLDADGPTHQLGSFQCCARIAKGAATKPENDAMEGPEMYFASMSRYSFSRHASMSHPLAAV